MSSKRILFFILITAALIRMPVAILMGDHVVELPGIQDQISYDALARSLLDGRGYSFTENWYPFTKANTPTAHWSFLYPLYLAGTYAVAGYHPLVARLIQGVLGGVLLCFLVYKLGRKLVSEETGLVGAGLTAVYGYFIYYNAALMTETFSIILVLLALHLSLELKEDPTPGRWVWLGFSLGLAALLRQTVLLFAPFLLLWLFLELRDKNVRWGYFAVPIVIIVLLITPWTLRNFQVYDSFLLLNSNAGYALYASNNPNMGSDWQNEHVVVPVPEELKGLNEAQLDRALTQRGLDFILADPGRIFLLNLNKILEYVRFWPTRESSQISNINRVLSFGLYLPFMLLGLWISFARWRNFVPLYLFMVIHTGIHLLSWPAPRYRLPIDAILMVFAGMALLELARKVKVWRSKPSLA